MSIWSMPRTSTVLTAIKGLATSFWKTACGAALASHPQHNCFPPAALPRHPQVPPSPTHTSPVAAGPLLTSSTVELYSDSTHKAQVHTRLALQATRAPVDRRIVSASRLT